MHCAKCSLKHRNILAKTYDAEMTAWFLSLAETDLEEYQKVLHASSPEAGSRKSKFNLSEYREETKHRKIRGEEQGDELMDWSRYLQYHTQEVFPTSERMTASEARTAWLKDLQSPSYERREVHSKKTGKTEWRDFVWEKVGSARRYKRREEAEERVAARSQSGNGSTAALSEARKRLQAAKFVALDADDTEFFRSFVAGFSKDDTDFCGHEDGDSAASKNRRNKAGGTRNPKASTSRLQDISFLRTPANCTACSNRVCKALVQYM